MSDPSHCPAVAIVGAGFAGTATAIELLRDARGPLELLLIDRSGRFGPGVPYSTPSDVHLLNQPAARMSLFADAPDDFRAWAAARLGACDPGAFLSRRLYGEYLSDQLARAIANRRPGVELRKLSGDVVALEPNGDGVRIELADGRAVQAERAVLAPGAPGGGEPSGLPDDPRVFTDPWDPGALEPPAPDSIVVLIGAGLTAVDAALSLCAGPGVRVLAISRSGMLPRTHLPGLREPAPAPAELAIPADARSLERLIRSQISAAIADGFDWRDAVDGLRPLVQTFWQGLSEDERVRVLQDGRIRRWEIRRHRMAPQIAARVVELQAQTRLRVVKGSLLGARAGADGIDVSIGVPEHGIVRTVSAARLISCTGLGGDISGAPEPLRGLLASGHAVADATGLGIRTAPSGALLDARGRHSDVLFTLGALRRGELWETTAVREIRQQARVIATELLARRTATADAAR